MMKAKLLLAMTATLSLGACASVKNVEMTMRGDPGQNRNEDNEPTAVRLRILRLEGPEAAQAFLKAKFDDVWADPIKAANVAISGLPQSIYLRPKAGTVPLMLEKVPPEVTHFGVLALFEKPTPGDDRLILTRDEVYSYEVVVHGYKLKKLEPGASSPPDQAKPDNQK